MSALIALRLSKIRYPYHCPAGNGAYLFPKRNGPLQILEARDPLRSPEVSRAHRFRKEKSPKGRQNCQTGLGGDNRPQPASNREEHDDHGNPDRA
jgi:hypothetical protein